jgi:hypothetical protein
VKRRTVSTVQIEENEVVQEVQYNVKAVKCRAGSAVQGESSEAAHVSTVQN